MRHAGQHQSKRRAAPGRFRQLTRFPLRPAQDRQQREVNRCAACCPSGRVFISTAS